MTLLKHNCVNCGGALEFDSKSQKMLCPYCRSVFEVEELKAKDGDLSQDQARETTAIDWHLEGTQWQKGEQEGMVAYSCRSCGGEMIGEGTQGTILCPFCRTPVVITSQFSGTLRPDVIIPFKLDKKAAVDALEKHYLKKRLLPKTFKNKNHIDEVKGVYVPFWLFSSDINARVEYNAEKVRAWSDSKNDYVETSTYRVMREGSIGFSHVPVDGSTAMDDALMDSIEPFYMDGAVDFQTAYLAGYLANKYDVGADQSFSRANRRISKSVEDVFAQTVQGFSNVRATNTSMQKTGGSVAYALFPVWLLTTDWMDKRFFFAMNGQTGTIAGDLPVDKAASRRWFWGITIGVFAAVTALTAIIWSAQGVLV